MRKAGLRLDQERKPCRPSSGFRIRPHALSWADNLLYVSSGQRRPSGVMAPRRRASSSAGCSAGGADDAADRLMGECLCPGSSPAWLATHFLPSGGFIRNGFRLAGGSAQQWHRPGLLLAGHARHREIRSPPTDHMASRGRRLVAANWLVTVWREGASSAIDAAGVHSGGRGSGDTPAQAPSSG